MDENYKGQSAAVLPGTYSNMAMLGFPDNALSSLQVPAGYRVVLYENENFGGKNYTITGSKNRFYLSGWSDKTSSIAVYRDR
ncbi:MAG: beta/gamma crystallin family protein [Bacteroidetes bacterium]|nr:beta/gamma crystallin family protein [Bacteroidota bacterium]